MSSIIPRAFLNKMKNIVEERLSIKWRDYFIHFNVQTRLIFSKSILLILLALFIFFSWITIEGLKSKTGEVFNSLHLFVMYLAILMNMNLWEAERDKKTYELLIMRVSNIHKFIWMKLSVSMIWALILLIPFWLGFTWFGSLSLLNSLLIVLFCIMEIIIITLITCVISSLVHHELLTGIVAFFVVFSISELFHIPQNGYIDLFINIFNDKYSFFNYTLFRFIRLYVLNRLFFIVLCAGIYLWLYRRMEDTEKWAA
jgi:hypothetical protein